MIVKEKEKEIPEIAVNVNASDGVEEGLVHLALVDVGLATEIEVGVIRLCVGTPKCSSV